MMRPHIVYSVVLLALGCSSNTPSHDGAVAESSADGIQLDVVSDQPSPVPDGPLPASKPVQLSLGNLHSCARLTNGSVWCWGNNLYKQLGDGVDDHNCPDTSGSDCSVRPVKVSGINTAIDISAGYTVACAVKQDGTVWCWGTNGPGIPLGSNAATPIEISGLPQITQVSVGNSHACARSGAGEVWCWGDDAKGTGKLGSGPSTAPGKVTGAPASLAVAAAADHTCALATDKTVWCWGSNDSGQLGIGQVGAGGSTPRQVQNVANVLQLTASENSTHTCVRLQSNAIQCWGRNILGALGTGNYDDRHTPAAVAGLSGLRSIAAGGLHTCAAKDDGTVSCWGANDWSQLGNGGASNGCTVVSSGFAHNCSPTPVQVVNSLPAVGSIYAGASWSCAIATDDTVWCWGANTGGELGDGTIENRAAPVRVVGF